MVREYYYLTKPGIVRGNIIAAIAGFLFASNGSFDFLLFLKMAIGLALVIASSCVVNNFLDRGIDSKMERTKKRALVTGEISVKNAFVFAFVLFVTGFVLLCLTTVVALATALAGVFFYVIVYGYFKRKSVYGTLVGSISGAIPPVVGYTAVTSNFDTGALLLFIVLACWQMPHFYAIGIYRKSEYKNAGIPILPVVRGTQKTKFQILIFSVGFFVSTMLLAVSGYTGSTYLIVMTAVGGYWVVMAHKGFSVADSGRWAKKYFSLSLIVLLVFCVMISIDFYLP